jgi:hypothetical protein
MSAPFPLSTYSDNKAAVARMERNEIRDALLPAINPDCAEFIVGRAFGATRWLHTGYTCLCLTGLKCVG